MTRDSVPVSRLGLRARWFAAGDPVLGRLSQGRAGRRHPRPAASQGVSSAVSAGMIFVHLGTVDRSFADSSAALAQLWAALDLRRLAHVATRRFDIAANWKLVVENFLDFYHLPFIHPQVGSTAAALDVDDVVLDERIIGGTYPRGAIGKASKAGRPMPTFGDVPLELQARQDIFVSSRTRSSSWRRTGSR